MNMKQKIGVLFLAFTPLASYRNSRTFRNYVSGVESRRHRYSDAIRHR